MPIDPNIALGYRAPDTLQTLGSLLNMAATKQGMDARALQMQGQQQQNTQGQINLQERQNLQPLLSDPSNYTDERGDIDWNKATPMIMRAAPTTGMTVLQGLAAAQQQRTNAIRTIATQTDENNQRAGAAIAGSTPETVGKTLEVLRGLYPSQDMQNVISQMGQHLSIGLSQAKGDPAKSQELIQKAARMFLPQQTQQEMNTPQGVPVNSGQETAYISTKPGTAVKPGQDLPGTRVQQQLPPGTPIMGRDENGNPTPGYLGPQPGRPGSPEARGSATTPASTKERLGILQGEYNKATNPDDRAAIQREMKRLGGQPLGFVASGLPVGQAENISNNVAEMNRHFGALQDQSTGVQLAQGLTGNIKALASGAATGTEAGRKAYLVGLLNTLHLGNQSTGDIQRDTDLLEKNMAQLGLNTPASTDAMRTLITAARPHSSMSKEAIEEAADQVASQVKANMAIRNALSSYKMMGDASGYQAARQKIEGIADPRAWQYEAMPPSQRRAFMGRLTTQDRSDLINKVKQLEQMGLLK